MALFYVSISCHSEIFFFRVSRFIKTPQTKNNLIAGQQRDDVGTWEAGNANGYNHLMFPFSSLPAQCTVPSLSTKKRRQYVAARG